MTPLSCDAFLRQMSDRWRLNQAVQWFNIPEFMPTSTNDAALKFICTFGGQDKAIFEFGTWIGRSTLGFAQNFGCVATIDLAKASDIQYSYKNYRPGQLVEGWSHVERIQANSLEYDFTRFKGKFDIVFVDGNHTTVGAMKDIETARFISKDSAIIFVDDYNNPAMGVTDAVHRSYFSQKYWLEDIKQVVLLR